MRNTSDPGLKDTLHDVADVRKWCPTVRFSGVEYVAIKTKRINIYA